MTLVQTNTDMPTTDDQEHCRVARKENHRIKDLEQESSRKSDSARATPHLRWSPSPYTGHGVSKSVSIHGRSHALVTTFVRTSVAKLSVDFGSFQ
nr:hypothetical protein Itr_chr10CG20640 [Ipomoea trifida]